jgi:nucleotide-binding universal stress UspA family protein
MFKHILIPTDGSELSEQAVRSGARLARTLKAKVTVMHVLQPVILPFSQGAMYANPDLIEQMQNEAKKGGDAYLDRGDRIAQEIGVTAERTLSDETQPWRGIVDTAQKLGCDLIVMAAHGRRGLSALIVGSETTKVLTHSTIPVLVYR